MIKTAGFDDWMHTIKLKLYGWASKGAIKKADKQGLEKALNDYTSAARELKNYRATLEALGEAKNMTVDLYRQMRKLDMDAGPAPKKTKQDTEIAQIEETMDKIQEVLDSINREIESRGLAVNRIAAGRLYLVEKTPVSERG